jgi:hypothetical protein
VKPGEEEEEEEKKKKKAIIMDELRTLSLYVPSATSELNEPAQKSF